LQNMMHKANNRTKIQGAKLEQVQGN
jgi:hypothetical protein